MIQKISKKIGYQLRYRGPEKKSKFSNSKFKKKLFQKKKHGAPPKREKMRDFYGLLIFDFSP